jgi:hypothetical protein
MGCQIKIPEPSTIPHSFMSKSNLEESEISFQMLERVVLEDVKTLLRRV